MNEHEIKLKKFLEKYPDEWHGYGTDKLTLKTVEGLHTQLAEMVLSRTTKQMKLNKRGAK